MTDHLFHIPGMTDLDKTRDYARQRSKWGLMTDGPNRQPPTEDTYIVLHHHDVEHDCAGHKHEVYKNGELELETTNGEVSAPFLPGRPGGGEVPDGSNEQP